MNENCTTDESCDCELCRFIGSGEQIFITEENEEEYKNSAKFTDDAGRRYVVLFSLNGLD